ncbi:hypothetical protein ACTXM3_10395 [Glutamicibacter arilaitensis]|uniref:hypothetical protein n=1 Tax=Glutamicibacter arilaitensis TaxID=256701 RepID=UPI003FD0B253
MAGTDTIRGIAYQQAQAIHLAIEIVELYPEHQIRVEGMDDVVDVEVLDADGRLVSAYQMKSRSSAPWTPKPIADVMRRWADLNVPDAMFKFVTNGKLGPGAQTLSEILANSDPDRTRQLATNLDIPEAVAERLTFARISVDLSSVGALLEAAERRIAARLDPLLRDRQVEAVQCVDRLVRVLMERSAHDDPAKRLFTATDLRELIGGENGERPEHQWPGGLKDSYLATVSSTSHALVSLTLTPISSGPVVEVNSLLSVKAAVLSGATGTGKSSAIQMLQASAAISGRSVVVCRAETYVPGHLGALVADALGFTLGTDIPTYAGRKVLADPSAVVIIDGVSEIPDATLKHLAEDLKPLLSRPGLASVVLVGRDPTVLRRLLDPAPVQEAFSVTPLENSDQDRLIESIVGPTGHKISQIRARAERVLGDGARNPMLLAIFVQSGASDSVELSRSAVYAKFLAHLSERAPSVDARTYLPLLGIVFARLLSAQRRYSDRYEWIASTDEAAHSLSPAIDGSSARAAGLRIGLITEVGMGVVAPFHDSLADYLAGTALAAGLAPLPNVLHPNQSEWMLFASELGVDVSGLVARDLPFLSVRVALADKNFPGSGSYAQDVAELLDTFLGTNGCTVHAKEALDGRLILRATDASGTFIGPTVVERERGPLYGAVRLWRLVLRSRFRAVPPILTPRPRSAEEAQSRVKEFVRQRQRHLDNLLNTFPDVQRSLLLDRLRPLGLTFFIGESEENWGAEDWPMSYVATVETCLLQNAPDERLGQTSASHFLNGGPARAAATEIQKEIEQLTNTSGWLA